MPTFFPPIRSEAPRFSHRDPVGHRHVMAKHAGIPLSTNVWLLKSGALTESQPTDPDLIDTVFHGAHYNDVSEAHAAILRAAGYEVSEV